jgi:hypothetical protein
MTDIIKEIYSVISKKEVLTVARELGLEVESSDRTQVVIELILDDLNENGVPENDDMSEEMKKFLITAKIIDKDGELISEEQTKEEDAKEEEEEEKLPECFGMADEYDPACKKCKVLQKCKKQREDNTPPCFGKLFEQGANECSICIENVRCRKVLGI